MHSPTIRITRQRMYRSWPMGKCKGMFRAVVQMSEVLRGEGGGGMG